MEQEVAQVIQAITIASDPSQISLHQQALEFLSNVSQNAAATWRLALAIFVETNADGTTRKHPAQARFWALRVLDEFFDNRFEPLDNEVFTTLQQAFLTYIRSEYLYGSAESGAQFLRNKFAHTLTLLFLCTYTDQWPSFFSDLFTLIRPSESSTSTPNLNTHVSLLFFHLVMEISGEVADNVIKSARAFTGERHQRDGRVRDAVRERDAASINEAVITIVSSNAQRMRGIQTGSSPSTTSNSELAQAVEVVDWGVRTYGSYVGWIDINLTVTPQTIELLFSLLSDPSLAIRLATAGALLRILSKGLKEPSDKLQLIKVLSLGQVITELEARTRTEQAARGEDTDEGEESFREALGRVLNILGLELLKLDEDEVSPDIREESTRLVEQTLATLLRFIADDYDDTSSTLFPFLQTLLGSYKKSRKTSTEPITPARRAFLTSLLEVLLQKLKWQEEDDPDDMDEDDKVAFEDMRKELRTFVDAVTVIDQDLVTEAVHTIAMNTLTAYRNASPLKWNVAELAVYLVYSFGEINKSGSKGRAAFCQAPAVPRENRKEIDYSSFPLTSHGEMLSALVQSNISAYPHNAVVMQFFETVARYGDFFKVRKENIVPTLEAMVDKRGLHNPSSAVQSRVFYLFQRFIKETRFDINPDLALNILDQVRDLLKPQIMIPELEDPEEHDLLTEAIEVQSGYQSQLYLFETVGALISLFYKSPEQSATLLMSVMKPLLDQLEAALQTPMSGPQDILPILTTHHIIMALGNIAKGFPDYPSPVPEGYILPPLDVFQQMAQAILVSLNVMNVHKVVRDATRFAFARIMATMGPSIAHLIPPLMSSMLTHFEPSELVDFMNFIGLLVHRLQGDIFNTLDELLGPLSMRILELLAQPVTGTDDQLQHNDTKRGFLTLLNSIMTAKLQMVFLSERNQPQLESLLTSVQRLALDTSDPSSQRMAFVFFGRCVSVWGKPADAAPLSGEIGQGSESGVPGFETFIYKSLVPTSFELLALPGFNIKDGQHLVVAHEVANFLQTVCRTRGAPEASQFLAGVFLPAQGWPQHTAAEFVEKLGTLEPKAFRKYFTDMVRASRA